MKKLSIIICVLVTLAACTKSKEVHPEIGDGNDEIVTVGMKDVHIEYTRTDHAELSRVVFHYCPADANGNAQQFEAVEMTKKDTFFELTLNDLLSDTLYCYYYELFSKSGNAYLSEQKTFRTQAFDTPEPPGPPTPPGAELPTVITGEVTGITAHSASCSGEVTSEGGAEVTERGICWSTNENPTSGDNHIATGSGIGAFTAVMENLEANITYHVRAYAINEVGTVYGLDKEFVTLSGNGSGDVPTGAVNGLFTINENGDKVRFSQGNLQYQASTNIWRFAENQWDYVGSQNPQSGDPGGTVNGSDNNNISSTYSGWIDLFGWGTGDNPTLTSTFDNNYSSFTDWGSNTISNGGNATQQWRTLTGGANGEWFYVFIERVTPSDILFAMAQVNGVNGVVLLPDNWSASTYHLNDANQIGVDFNRNVISASQWDILQNAGAVFLPAAGCRQDGASVYITGSYGAYWSASGGGGGYTSAGHIWFRGGALFLYYNDHPHYGLSVRLVCPAD